MADGPSIRTITLLDGVTLAESCTLMWMGLSVALVDLVGLDVGVVVLKPLTVDDGELVGVKVLDGELVGERLCVVEAVPEMVWVGEGVSELVPVCVLVGVLVPVWVFVGDAVLDGVLEREVDGDTELVALRETVDEGVLLAVPLPVLVCDWVGVPVLLSD